MAEGNTNKDVEQIAFMLDRLLKRRFDSKIGAEGRTAKDTLADLIRIYVGDAPSKQWVGATWNQVGNQPDIESLPEQLRIVVSRIEAIADAMQKAGMLDSKKDSAEKPSTALGVLGGGGSRKESPPKVGEKPSKATGPGDTGRGGRTHRKDK